MPITTPNVHRIYTGGAGGRHITLGFVDTDGVYHFPDGRQVLANGDAIAPHVGKTGSSTVVRADGSLQVGGLGAGDGQDPTYNAERAKHSVDRDYQAAYDNDPDLTPAEVFAAIDGA